MPAPISTPGYDPNRSYQPEIDDLRESITLSPVDLSQIQAIRQRIGSNQTRSQPNDAADRNHDGKVTWADAYNVVYEAIKDHPAAREDRRDFWFEQAQGINNDDSLSSAFIRNHTRIGLDLAGVPYEQRLPMQQISDLIGQQVIEDVTKSGQVPPLAHMLGKDIGVALERGGVQIGGWGAVHFIIGISLICNGMM